MKQRGKSGNIFPGNVMGTRYIQFRDQQKETWNRYAPGWKKWNDLTMDFLKPVGDEIIRFLRLRGDELILDIASGTGEPGFSIATRLKRGKVIATDLSERMLEVAQENARIRGIKNFETRVCDASDLPFEDNTFDAISCRFGFMFFPDLLQSASEMVRVLKPGGRIAASVWSNPEKNFWITAAMNTLNKNIQLPPSSPDTPGIFRCAERGFMADLFRKAGLINITETEVYGKLKTGTTDVYWNYLNDVVAPVSTALKEVDEGLKLKIKREVTDSVLHKYPGKNIVFDSDALVIYGEKSSIGQSLQYHA
jgi:ubiquinone/menaquinone biosynthesis C-methylase UbiE